MMYFVSEEEWYRKYEKLREWRANTARSDSDKNLGPIVYKKVIDDLNIPKSSVLLDVGCGNCRTKSLLPEGVNYFGIDPFPIVSEEEMGPLSFRVGEAENIPFDENTFDILFCFASIFHFRDLNRSFSEMNRVLKFGGKLFLMTVMNEELSESHTFIITHEMLCELGIISGFKLVDKKEIPEIKSWLYEWEK